MVWFQALEVAGELGRYRTIREPCELQITMKRLQLDTVEKVGWRDFLVLFPCCDSLDLCCMIESKIEIGPKVERAAWWSILTSLGEGGGCILLELSHHMASDICLFLS